MVMPPLAGQEIPAGLASFDVVIIHGKTIKRLAKRLKSLRSAAGGAVEGNAAVALSLRSGMALAMQAQAKKRRQETL